MIYLKKKDKRVVILENDGPRAVTLAHASLKSKTSRGTQVAIPDLKRVITRVSPCKFFFLLFKKNNENKRKFLKMGTTVRFVFVDPRVNDLYGGRFGSHPSPKTNRLIFSRLLNGPRVIHLPVLYTWNHRILNLAYTFLI